MYNTHFVYGARLSQDEARTAPIRAFLERAGLYPDGDADFTVYLTDYSENIVATASLAGNVAKFIAVDPAEQGTGAAATVISEVVNYAYREGVYKLYIFTKPEHENMFTSMGFVRLAATDSALMLENDRTGLKKYLASLKRPDCAASDARIGAIVANCNPMTLGHLYLMETAAAACDFLHVFILSEDKSFFPAQTRYEIVKEATEHIPNLYLQKTSDYMISSATFPTYFIKDRANAAQINADLDLTLFAERIAPELGITVRFVGTEPFCAVTSAYNERMKLILPRHGIAVEELERKDSISASCVRELMAARDLDAIRKIVPDATYKRIEGMLG